VSAEGLLRDDSTVGSVCMVAMEALLGSQWRVWEPETLWLELDHRGVDPSLGNRQQIMAGRSLLTTGRFFYDALVYDRACAVFSNEESNFDVMGESTVISMAWAVDEALKICHAFDDPPLDWDREVAAYAAHQLYSEGFVLCPEELSFAQPVLDKLYGGRSGELKNEVRELWADLSSHEIRSVPYPETSRGVQLARLAATHTYVAARRAMRTTQLAQLK
jgi:hypothetical protein